MRMSLACEQLLGLACVSSSGQGAGKLLLDAPAEITCAGSSCDSCRPTLPAIGKTRCAGLLDDEEIFMLATQ